MGKSLHLQGSQSPPEGHSSGKMKGILQHFPHNPWNKVKKKLPHKKHDSGKQSIDKDTNKTTLEADEPQKNSDSAIDDSEISGDVVKKPSQHHQVVTKVMELGRSPKNLMKFRLKALINDEKNKKKNHHRKATSCPDNTELDTPNPAQNPKSSDADSPAEGNTNDEVLRGQDKVNPVALLDPVLPKIGSDSSNLCTPELSTNYLKQSEVEKIVQQPVRDHTILQDESIFAIEPSKDATVQESKLFMDALDLLNMRKEMFLRIVQDQNSSLAQQLQSRGKSNLQSSLTKSLTFPVPGSSARQAHEYGNPVNRQVNGSCLEKEGEFRHSVDDNMLVMSKGSDAGNDAPPQLSRELKHPTNSSPTSSMLRKMHANKVALNQFRKLSAKLKDVLRGKKSEKERIVKDAVHHKVPYGQNMTPISRSDKLSSYNSGSSRIHQPGSDFGKTPLQSFKRTSSFNESVHRYNRLLDTNSNREAQEGEVRKDPITSREDKTLSIPKRGPPMLGRILSLPALRSFPSMRTKNSASDDSWPMPDTTSAGNTCDGSADLTEQKPLCVGSENELDEPSVLQSENQRNLSDIDKTSYDCVNSMVWDSSSPNASNLEPVPSSPPQPSEQYEVSQNDFNYQDREICQGPSVPTSEDSKEDSSAIEQENAGDMDTLESKVRQYYGDHLHVQVDAKNETEFNYVKDVLELSGFSRDEILGKWYSDEYPVDPMVFDEVEGCMLDWSGYGEGDNSDHMLLFDLINEVLLRIYERSCCYWPMPLTSQSRIHRMPKGQHVLEEVWEEISWLLCLRLDDDQPVEDLVIMGFSKRDDWMNLRFDTECVGLEVEDFIFDDLLEEIFST